ncbi:LysR family transcriptional regulator [Variovorax sp. JS1663]|uniref:LysR family transcriptional regulator n=1 Tax=Variovorax sp. JS1663 TaxID=1851577 RepID=UPI000B3474A5|nr:LysR family transcriptional regulator [Variovorax sp. JS1663]OUL98720.1 LysR family transcriptional regulator [Variovorax sp. JS1663]
MKESSTSSPPPSDRIELMNTFVQIVEAGSLSAAATQMRTTQPTVSRRLQALEKQLGVRLLRRSTHALKLTEDGERCFSRAKDLLADWQAFEAELRGDGEPEGTLRVMVPHAFGQELLVKPLADYVRRYPRVSVDWLLNDRQPDFIGDGVDCAIHVGEVSDPGVVAIKLAEVPRIVVAAPSVLPAGKPRPRHASELGSLPWLALRTYYRTELTLTRTRDGEQCRIPMRPRVSTDSLYALKSAAVMGLGACVGSTWLLGEEIAAGRLVQLTSDWQAAPLPCYLIYPYARLHPPKLRRFVETVRGGWGDGATA